MKLDTGTTTWRKEVLAKMKENNEDKPYVFASTLSEEELDIEFDSKDKTKEVAQFTVWGGKNIYFPTHDGGADWCSSIPITPSIAPSV